MRNNEIKRRLEEIFKSSLSQSEINELVKIVEKDGINISDLEDINGLSDLLGKEIEIPAYSTMDKDFYAMLEVIGNLHG